MKSLFYIVLRSLRNTIVEFFHKPKKLLVFALTIGLILFIALMPRTNDGAPPENGYAPLFWLKGVLFLYLLLLVVPSVTTGLSNGGTFFGMNDVNFIFASPVNPRATLLYGLFGTFKSAFLTGFFILFQSATLENLFGFGYSSVIFVMIAFILTAIAMSILSVLIYSVASGNPRRKLAVKLITVAVFVPVAVLAVVNFIQSGDIKTALELTVNSPVASFTPIVGWASQGATALIAGSFTGWLFLGLLVLACAGAVIFIMLSNPDYYEDVLVATETAFERRRNAAEGRASAREVSVGKTKLKRTGITGSGANAIFHKHLRETFRANRFGLWGIPTLLITAGIGVFSFFMRNSEGTEFALLGMLVSFQIIRVSMGRGVQELTMHYIYMVPASAFSKLVWSNIESLVKFTVESALIFTVSGIILRQSPLAVVATIAAFALFSLMLIGINYVSLRFTGADLGAGITVALYYIAGLIAVTPGIVAGAIAGVAVGGDLGYAVGVFVVAAWEAVAALICFSLSKGVLHDCDISSIKTSG
ncbi:MAG: putative ABC exporter domain-containing protein [Oscillospiraceae bacterium]|jgi:hypothetical protein|nr:putative ABC exporter domain-containing protein [Oscillospiraceae bacterium]